MKISDISAEIFLDMGSPTSTSIPAIAYWVRGKVGALNVLLCEDFSISTSYEIVDGGGTEITPEAVSVIKSMYLVYDYDIQIRSTATSLATSSVIELTDSNQTVRKTNKNETIKALTVLKGREEDALKALVSTYKIRLATPVQTTGDDVYAGNYRNERVRDYRIYNQ